MKLRVAKWTEKPENKLDAKGLIRLNTNKPEFGSIMLISSAVTISNGFANTRNKVGFVTGEVDGLKQMIKEYGLVEGADFSEKVGPHKIVTFEKVESDMTEADLGYREKINPSTGELLTKDGEKIYWKTEVVAEGSDAQDSYVQHDREPVDETAREFSGADENPIELEDKAGK
jgi:hypothetical protein